MNLNALAAAGSFLQSKYSGFERAIGTNHANNYGGGIKHTDSLDLDRDSLYSSIFSNKKFNPNSLASTAGMAKEFKSNLKRDDSKDSIH